MECRQKEKHTTSAMADVQIVDPLACLAKQDAYGHRAGSMQLLYL
jgi:hypothetical protein